jgi:hypothetical protein
VTQAPVAKLALLQRLLRERIDGDRRADRMTAPSFKSAISRRIATLRPPPMNRICRVSAAETLHALSGEPG